RGRWWLQDRPRVGAGRRVFHELREEDDGEDDEHQQQERGDAHGLLHDAPPQPRTTTRRTHRADGPSVDHDRRPLTIGARSRPTLADESVSVMSDPRVDDGVEEVY